MRIIKKNTTKVREAKLHNSFTNILVAGERARPRSVPGARAFKKTKLFRTELNAERGPLRDKKGEAILDNITVTTAETNQKSFFKIESEACHQLNIIENVSKLLDNTPNIKNRDGSVISKGVKEIIAVKLDANIPI